MIDVSKLSNKTVSELLKAATATIEVLTGKVTDDVEPNAPSGAVLNLCAYAVQLAECDNGTLPPQPRPAAKQPPWAPATNIGKFTPRRFRIMRETVPQIKVDGSEYYHYGVYFPLQDTTMYDKGKQRQGKPKEPVEWIDDPPQGT